MTSRIYASPRGPSSGTRDQLMYNGNGRSQFQRGSNQPVGDPHIAKYFILPLVVTLLEAQV